MSNPKTLEDPIDPAVMAELDRIYNARSKACEQVVEIEQTKVRLLVAINQLDLQHAKIFERELLDRGQSPTAVAVIDETSRLLKLKGD